VRPSVFRTTRRGRSLAGMAQVNREFQLGGVHHLALVCSDMQRTVGFYSGVLGMPLVKTIELPRGMGQHFFFDCGNGDSLAFFWFAHAPDGVPGISAPAVLPGDGDIVSAVGSMNHVAFTVPEGKFLEYYARMQEKGIDVSAILDHDNSPSGAAREYHPGVFVRSFYFRDPDGVMLEFACWTTAFTEADVAHAPRTAADRTVPAGIR
jgi:catechol 2,3-dioxygenase-like lactoylglutathione lyase family enzyme